MHGLRNRFGTTIAAACDDCHGAHLVLPASDPESTISPGNIVATCGACHPGANEHFVEAPIHVEATAENSLGVFAVRWFYIVFIAVLGDRLRDAHRLRLHRGAAPAERRTKHG